MDKKSKIVIYTLWSASVLAALFIGQALQQPVSMSVHSVPSKKLEAQPAIVNQQPEVQEKESRPVIQKPEKVSSTVSSLTPVVSVRNVIDDLKASFENHNYYDLDNYRSMADVWEKVKLLSEDELYEMFEELDNNSEKGITWNLARVLYTRMGELNPERAVDHALINKQSYSVNFLLKKWGNEAPLKALSWAEKNSDELPSNVRMDYYSLFNKVAEVDREKAFESLSKLDPVHQKNAFNGILKTVETSEDFMKVLSLAETMNDNHQKTNSVLYYWSQKSPYDAIAYAEGITSEKDRKAAFSNIENSWLKKNPAEAAEWIMKSAENKRAAVSKVIKGWGWQKGSELYDWVQTQTEPEVKDQANYQLVRRYSYNNSDLSRKALENIESEKLRKQAVTSVFHSLRYKSKKAAEEFLQGRDEIPEEEKESILTRYSKNRR